jgi:hypothetical protein
MLLGKAPLRERFEETVRADGLLDVGEPRARVGKQLRGRGLAG